MTEKQSPVTVDDQRRGLEDLLLDTRALLELADKAHLLPLIFLFSLVGLLGAITLALKYLFRCMAEVIDDWYEFRAQCASSKARFQQTSMKGP